MHGPDGTGWLWGQWRSEEVREISHGPYQAVFLGVVGLPDDVLAGKLAECARAGDCTRLARLPGSYLVLARSGHGLYGAGDVAGLRRLSLCTRSGTLQTGALGNEAGHVAVPPGHGVRLRHGDGTTISRYWTDGRRDLPAALTAPVLAQRLITAVDARLRQVRRPAAGPGQVLRLLDRLLATARAEDGELCWHADGITLLGPAASRRLPRLTDLVPPGEWPWPGHHYPFLDAHVLAPVLATRPADRRRGRLLDALRTELS